MTPDPAGAALAELLLAAGVLLATVVALGLRRLTGRVRDMQRDTSATRRQVQNSHATNLRDDLDGLRDQLGELLASVHRIEGRLDADRDAATREHRNLWSAVNNLRALTRKEP